MATSWAEFCVVLLMINYIILSGMGRLVIFGIYIMVSSEICRNSSYISSPKRKKKLHKSGPFNL